MLSTFLQFYPSFSFFSLFNFSAVDIYLYSWSKNYVNYVKFDPIFIEVSSTDIHDELQPITYKKLLLFHILYSCILQTYSEFRLVVEM